MLNHAHESFYSLRWQALYSGAIPPAVTAQILNWHQTSRAALGSRLKLGVLTGSGGDVQSGDALETFTLFGWGYGLLQAGIMIGVRAGVWGVGGGVAGAGGVGVRGWGRARLRGTYA